MGEGDGVAIMCRNHRGFIEATVAPSKLGAHALFLNTAFAAPQLTEVVEREKPAAIVYDQEFAGLLEDAGKRRKRFVAWVDGRLARGPHARRPDRGRGHQPPVPPARGGPRRDPDVGDDRHAKGRLAQARRTALGPAIALLSRIPLKAGERTMIAAPLFHSWGFAHFTLGLLLYST